MLKKKKMIALTEEQQKMMKKLNRLQFVITAASCLVVFFILFLNFQVATVPSSSMYPTLKIKEFVLIHKFRNPVQDLEYGDIATFYHHENGSTSIFIKRLIGKPGDTVEVRHDAVYRNGERVFENYRLEAETNLTMEPITLKENEYFLMGDNWNNSADCRVFGSVLAEDLIGKAIFHFSPFEDERCEQFVFSVPAEMRHPDFEAN